MTWYRVVGTSHVAKEALQRTEEAFAEFSPDVVAVELDANRLHALLSGARPNYSPRLIPQLGLRGYLFGVVGGFVQRRLGNLVHVQPGADMLAAARLAQRNRKRILLMDQDVRVTLRKLSSAFGWRETKQLVKDAWRGLRGERFSFDLTTVPDAALVAKLLGEFRERYPRLHKALVRDRDVHMVKALRRYHELNPDEKVLVVLGAGHEPGVTRLLAKEL